MVGNAYTRAVQNYKQEAVLTMSPGEIVIALFDECIKMLLYTQEHIKNKNIQGKSDCLKKAIKIIEYMTASLDMKYPISSELENLYEYYIWEMRNVNLHNDIQKCGDLISMITEIRDGFKGANAEVAKSH
ncbi:hypothetical protein FACS1894132_13390 [Clostridia bacterium]|nr:hypothetical protein FACS1894132_13390 [Clostridia bacterium]